MPTQPRSFMRCTALIVIAAVAAAAGACSEASPAAEGAPSAAGSTNPGGAGAGGVSTGSAGTAGVVGGAGTAGAVGSADAGRAGASGSGGSRAAAAGASGGGTGAPPTAGSAAAGHGAGAPAPGDGCGSDPLAMLRAFAPADEELASDYEDYLTDELGTVVCMMEGSGGARTITQTIVVPPGAVYDGHGEQLTADVAMMRCDTSEGEQAESQRPFFVLAPGAQLKNVTIRYPGCEGVHMLGDNVLENIVWEDAGEDAASVRSYFPGGTILIKDSEGHKAADKMFQFNAPCDVRIEGFTGSDMGKLVRQNGGTEFELKIDLNTVTVTSVISAVVQSDSPLCFVRHHALSYEFTGSGDKSDRVFRDIPPANVTEY